jgi:hypothetical protein
MKSFKDIRDGLSEEYYTGPTAYVGGDKTNVGNVNGADLGNLPDTKTPYAAPDAMDHLRKDLQAELDGVHLDVVHTISKAATKFSSTGLVFEMDSVAMRDAANRGDVYETPLTFGGHPLGEAPDDNPADDFAAREVGDTGQVPYEKTLPETSVRFSFESVGTGYKINVDFV